MARQATDDVTDTELAILQVLWDQGKATRRQITDELYPGGGEAHYATVQNLLGRLERKGFARHDRGEGVLVFTPTVARDELIRRRLQVLSDQLCGGAVAPLVMNLVRSQPLSQSEVEQLYAFLREQSRAAETAKSLEIEGSRAVDALFRLVMTSRRSWATVWARSRPHLGLAFGGAARPWLTCSGSWCCSS